MEIKVIGAGCDTCNQLYQNVQQAVEQLGLQADVQKVEDLVEIVRLGVMAAPSLMVDGKLVLSGRVGSVKTVVDLLQRAQK